MDSLPLVRWEAGSGLEHACWQCGLKANHPKARQTCYGIHSIPCIRYHGTMFSVGNSHDCTPCTSGDEVHNRRHREIAALLKEYQTLLSGSDSDDTPKSRAGNQFDQLHRAAPEQRLRPRERGDLETLSTTSTGHDDEKQTKAEKRAYKKALKEQKSVKKAARNAERHPLSTCQADIDRVAAALHPSNAAAAANLHPLATDQAMQEVIFQNLGFTPHIQGHALALNKSARGARHTATPNRRSRRRSGHTKSSSPDAETSSSASDELVNAVLSRLGVAVASGPSTAAAAPRRGSCCPHRAACAAALHKLMAAVREDLEKHENELRETYARAAGYWRWVGRVVFERMTLLVGRVDWATGRVLKGVDDEDGEEEGEGEGEEVVVDPAAGEEVGEDGEEDEMLVEEDGVAGDGEEQEM